MKSDELMQCARQQETAAWEQLVAEHQEAVFRLAYLMLGDADDAADIAQESFLRAFRARARFDPSRPLRPWLLQIAANLARNRRRSLGRYLAVVRRFAQRLPPPVQPLEEYSEQQWEAQLLWQAIRRVKPHEQEALYLRYFLDLSEAEMAEVLAVAPGTVKSRLHRAVAHLRVVIEREFPALKEERQP